MRTAYIKEGKVMYIAAFTEDRIQPNAKGKLLFGGSSYDAETGQWNHALGTGEEVIEVSGEGLGVGDTYVPTDPAEPAQAPVNKSLQEAIAAKQAELQAVRQQILDAQADENGPLLAELRPKRDRLKQELEVLEKEVENI